MNCDSVTKLISLYFYGELSPEEEDRLEQHLDGCAQGRRSCKAETRDQVGAVRRVPSAGADGNVLSEVTRRRYRWFSLGSVSGAVRREP